MNTTTVLLCYVIQIPLAIYALFFMPRRGTLSTPMENVRRNSAIIGFLPCMVASILIQVVSIAVYYGRIKSIERKERETAARIFDGGRTTTGTGGNPFGATPPVGQAQAPTNPFDAGQPSMPDNGPQDRVDRPADNPFL